MSRNKEQRFPVAGKEREKDIFNLFLLIFLGPNILRCRKREIERLG